MSVGSRPLPGAENFSRLEPVGDGPLGFVCDRFADVALALAIQAGRIARHADPPFGHARDDAAAFFEFSRRDDRLAGSVKDCKLADGNLMQKGAEIATLASAPLWPGGAPQWAADGWRDLKAALLAKNETWNVWTEWYDDRLSGRDRGEGTELVTYVIAFDGDV